MKNTGGKGQDSMPTKIYTWTKNKSGDMEKRYLTTREVKAYIMKQNKWTAEQYQKQYDIFKNKLRAYESYKQAQGAKVQKQSVSEVLYKEARAKQLYGPTYKPSQKLQQIKGFSAYSITKGRQLAKQKGYQAKQAQKYGTYINTRFGGLLEHNKGAQDIQKAFIEDAQKKGESVNYAKMEEALTDYANKIGGRVSDEEVGTTPNNLPSGEVYGSDEQIDFDVNDYL